MTYEKEFNLAWIILTETLLAALMMILIYWFFYFNEIQVNVRWVISIGLAIRVILLIAEPIKK